MAITNQNVNTLASVSDFMGVDLSIANGSDISSNNQLSPLVGSNVSDNGNPQYAIHYKAADNSNPTGTWVVNNKQASAGMIVLAKMYSGWLSANSSANDQLNVLSTNAKLANASSKLANKLSEWGNAGQSKTYNDLLGEVTNIINNQGLGVTPAQFIEKVLPGINSGEPLTKSKFDSMADTARQFSNARLTDNSVLQQKYDTATSVINSTQDAMSNVLKAWTNLQQSLAKAI